MWKWPEGKRFKYSFTKSTGKSCCQSDNPKHLCPKCRIKAGLGVDLNLSGGSGGMRMSNDKNGDEVEAFLSAGTPEEKAAWKKLLLFLYPDRLSR